MEKFPVAACLTMLLSLLISGPGLLQRSTGGDLPEDFMSALSLRPEAVQEGQVYRLATYIFVYKNVTSLVCSAVIVWYFASSFEKMVGTVKQCFLTLAFAVSLALLCLLLWAVASGLLKTVNAEMNVEGFIPVAFSMLAASVARSQMKRTVLFGVNIYMALVPWALLCVAWILPSSSLLANFCGLLIGNIYGYGYCFCLDLSESTASYLDQKFPFRLLKRIPAVKYVPGSLAERRAAQSRKLNPVPGSYPTQSPPPASLDLYMQHPNVPIPVSQSSPFLGYLPHQVTGVIGESYIQNHFQQLSGIPSASHHLGSKVWVPTKTDDLVAGAASESEEVCQVHVN